MQGYFRLDSSTSGEGEGDGVLAPVARISVVV